MAKGVLKLCNGLYCNLWFLVQKKQKGTFQLINAAIKMNKHIIWNANLLLLVNEFLEEFASCSVTLLIDLFLGYNQIVLSPESWDLMAFQMPIGLLQITQLPQGATNFIAQFVQIITKVLQDLILEEYLLFLNNIGVKGPCSIYNNAEIAPGVWQYIKEYI